LPFGPFDPIRHRTLDVGLRAWVEEQTPLKLGYVEQLYSFGDRGRHAHPATSARTSSFGRLPRPHPDRPRSEALARPGELARWYDFFPFEDWRGGRPAS
jgi:hypothetical protein